LRKRHTGELKRSKDRIEETRENREQRAGESRERREQRDRDTVQQV
jgi:hypothetical protein